MLHSPWACELSCNVQTRRFILFTDKDTQWCRWLRDRATSQKVAGSIPDAVTEIFHQHNPPMHTVAHGSTLEYKGYVLVVKVAGAYGWQPCLQIFRARRVCKGSKMATVLMLNRTHIWLCFDCLFILFICLFIYLLSWVKSIVIVKL
jgi:hypothetical protein